MTLFRGRKDGKFYVWWWCVLFLEIFLTLALGRREHRGYLAYKCLSSHRSSWHKPPVIMLHGLTETKETWDGIYQKIPLLTGRKVCIYDARNHGDSSWNNTFSIDALAEELECFMNNLNIKRATLVGHNMGALTAMKLALNNPRRVESILVEDTSVNELREEIAPMLRALFRVLQDSLFIIPPHADPKTAVRAVKKYVTQVTGHPPPEYLFKRFPFRRLYGRWHWKADFEIFIRALEDPDAWIGRMDGVYKGDVLFIYGKACPYRITEDKEHIRRLFPNSEFYGVEGSSHHIHHHHPIFFKILVEFLNRKECHKFTTNSFIRSERIKKFDPLQYAISSFFHSDKTEHFGPLEYAAHAFFHSDGIKEY